MTAPVEKNSPKGSQPSKIPWFKKPLNWYKQQSGGMKGIVVGGTIVVLGAATWLLWPASSNNMAATYREQTVAKGNVVEKVSALGVLKPVRSQEIKAMADGKVVKLHIQNTAAVTAGQSLMSMDNSASQAKVSSYEASLAQARYDLKKATTGSVPAEVLQAEQTVLQEEIAFQKASSNLARIQELYNNGAATKEELEQAQRDYKLSEQKLAAVRRDRDAAKQGWPDRLTVLQNKVKEAEANLKQAKLEYNSTEVKAPFNGRVLTLDVEEGAVVGKNDVLATVADLSTIRGSFYVNEIDITKVQVGMEAQVKVDALGGKVFTGKVSLVGQNPKTVDNIVNYEVLVDIDNSAGELRSGMTMSTDIIIQSKENVLSIPLEALSERNGESGVMMGSTTRPQFVPVKTGIRTDTSVEILEGLNEGDIILVGGVRRTNTNSNTNGGANPFGGGATRGLTGGGSGGNASPSNR